MTRDFFRILPFLVAPLVQAHAQGDITPVASHTVTTQTRTLRDCPLKRVITTREGWDHVTAGLEGAPPAPDFDKHVAVLVVADVTGGARSELTKVRKRPDGALHVVLERDEPLRIDTVPTPTLKCFFLVVPPFDGGVHLDHRTRLEGEGSGHVVLASPPAPKDRDPKLLPTLGPDLRMTYVMKDGSPPPRDGILLRQESVFPRQDLTGRVQTGPFPPEGVVAAYPRFRDGVKFVLAAHGPNHRSVKPLELSALPPDGPDGNPRPMTYQFVLEPIVGPGK